jgi:hypothetical protein
MFDNIVGIIHNPVNNQCHADCSLPNESDCFVRGKMRMKWDSGRFGKRITSLSPGASAFRVSEVEAPGQ